MNRIIGRFFFKRLANGDLEGCYSSNLLFTIENHRAKPQNESRGFIGLYSCTWLENEGVVESTLTITQKQGSNNLFSLHWQGLNFNFWGEGFIANDILIGDYRNFETI